MSSIIHLDSISSTNREAKRRGLAGAADGTVIVAAEQTAGRGRLGRDWVSPRGGLWMSAIVRRNDPDAEAPMPALSIAAGVAVSDALQEIFMELGLDTASIRLGWPNDVLVDDKKIAGILTETCSIPQRSSRTLPGRTSA